MAEQEELPRDRIFLRNGRVMAIEEWVNWNGDPFPTITIKRREGDFLSTIGTPDSGATKIGSLDEVIAGLHEKIKPRYVQLFGLETVSGAAITALGFRRFEIVP